MSHRTEANIRVDGFAIATGEGPTRLELPKAELAELRGSAGGLEYVATGLTFEGLQGRFDPMYWSAEGLTANGLVVHDRDVAVAVLSVAERFTKESADAPESVPGRTIARVRAPLAGSM